VVLDNLSTHKPSRDMWLPRHKNVHFHHTPTHASWLSQIEIWFSILTSQSLNGASFTSVKDLVAHIDAFIDQYNQTPKTLRLDQIQGPPKAPQAMFRGPMVPGISAGVRNVRVGGFAGSRSPHLRACPTPEPYAAAGFFDQAMDGASRR